MLLSQAVVKSPLRVSWLDLRGSGLSILERLLLEECLLRHDDQNRNWLIAGTHEASRHRYLQVPDPPYVAQSAASAGSDRNTSTAIVLGLGGKPDQLLNIPLVQREGCLSIKRFTGGGTVVLDSNSIWTTLIFRPHEALPESFPRPIMEWSAQEIFGPLFTSLNNQQQTWKASADNDKNTKTINLSTRSTLVLDTKSCGVENTGRTLQLPRPTIPTKVREGNTEFALRENDYVLGDHKMGGNAQSITKNGWLHHTSFLWDYQPENMNYLTLPQKRPEYRQDRPHSDFLVKLRDVYPHLTTTDFIKSLGHVMKESFQVEQVRLPQALQVVEQQGGFQAWFQGSSRTRVLSDLS